MNRQLLGDINEDEFPDCPLCEGEGCDNCDWRGKMIWPDKGDEEEE